MRGLRFHCEVNPFGALYNPQSILDSLNLLASKRQLTADDLFVHDELWSSFMFHSSFPTPPATARWRK